MIYNTSQKDIVLREYGRNIQNVVEHLKTIEDREKRTALAHLTVDLMKQIAPAAKETTETNQKLWDDLFIISDFDLDVDCPFPIPESSVLTKKPERMKYVYNRIKYKHYGRNLELLVLEALKKEDPQERENAIIYIGKLMKSFYTSWNKETIDDSLILENIKSISDGKLDIDLDKVKEDNLFEKLYKSKPRKSGPQRSQGKGKGSSNRRRRRN
ncbi:MAG: DUF4290 domain-containing protein [Cyclobacteriaceae bacterium]